MQNMIYIDIEYIYYIYCIYYVSILIRKANQSSLILFNPQELLPFFWFLLSVHYLWLWTLLWQSHQQVNLIPQMMI